MDLPDYLYKLRGELEQIADELITADAAERDKIRARLREMSDEAFERYLDSLRRAC